MIRPLSKRFNPIFCLGYWLCGFVPLLVLGQPKFADVTLEAGINHSFDVFQGTFGGGAAVIDFNMDGWEDLFIAGGEGADQLLLNRGDGSFEDVAKEAGLDVLDGFVTQGAAVADVNKDGWPDLFVTTIAFVFDDDFSEAPNVLLINNKDGSFRDESLAFNIVEKTFSTSASFGDVNRDGYPDLYVGNYFENFEGNLDKFSGPQTNGDARPGKDLLYINKQGTGFVEASERYGIERIGLTFQALWTDFDNDNDLDVLVANDFGNRSTPNLLYRNEYPDNKFTEIGAERNFDYGINAMGIGVCDVNMDGWMDYLVTNIQISPFFINQGGEAAFVEESVARGTGYATIGTESGVRTIPVSWGVNFFDVDHDMDTDLYITNGSLNPSLAPNPNIVLENVNGRFLDRGFFSRANDHSIGRGSVVFDYDRDGDLDLLVVNQGPFSDENVGVVFRGTRLFRNENDSQNNWIKVKLEGARSESNGIGSRIEAYVGETMMVREIYGGSSHESQNTTIAHFGLGTAASLDSIVVKWSAGGRQVLMEVEANQQIAIVEEVKAEQNLFNEDAIIIYPNPVESFTNIQFKLKESADWSLDIYNLLGAKIRNLQTGEGAFGTYILEEPHDFAPGVYVVSLSTPDFAISKKLFVK